MSETDGPEDQAMALWPKVSAIQGAHECLSMLQGKFSLSIATNAAVSTQPLIEQALGRVGLDKYFTNYFCFTEVGYKKSQSEFWKSVQNQLELQPHQIVMFGDSLEQDVIAPSKFGIKSVWFNADGARQVPSNEIVSVTRLEDFSKYMLLANHEKSA
ncbi:HAD family hydrolase [Niveibacterium sp. COAC-50]|uniref:HAD family hydrolase n=1 Tax=Niveibacterium sp. COAC-50 TaxID=2729384 RepID=UPI001551BE90|nr:HAD hydrolase-like protein [Niveibacterium sp. COAC-50]